MSNTGDSVAVGMRGAEGVIFDSRDATGSAFVSSIETAHVSPKKELQPHVAQINAIDPTIAKQFVCTSNFVWKSTDPISKCLWSVPIMPNTANMWLKYLSGMYNTWRGGFDYKIKIAGTGFHSGALLLVRLPPNFAPSKVISTSDVTAFPYVVIDPKCLEAISHGAMDQANIMYHWIVKDTERLPPEAIGGHIAVYVMLQLGNNSDTPTSINVQIFSKPSADFVFGQLVPPVFATAPLLLDANPNINSVTSIPFPSTDSAVAVGPNQKESYPASFGTTDINGDQRKEYSCFFHTPDNKLAGPHLDKLYFEEGSVSLQPVGTLGVKDACFLPVSLTNWLCMSNSSKSGLPENPNGWSMVKSPSTVHMNMPLSYKADKKYYYPFISPSKKYPEPPFITNYAPHAPQNDMPLGKNETFVFLKNSYMNCDGTNGGSVNVLQSNFEVEEFRNFPIRAKGQSYKVRVCVATAGFHASNIPPDAVMPGGASWVWTFFRLAYDGAMLVYAISTYNALAAGKVVLDIVDVFTSKGLNEIEDYSTPWQNTVTNTLPLVCFAPQNWRNQSDVKRFLKWYNPYDITQDWSIASAIMDFGENFPFVYLEFFFAYSTRRMPHEVSTRVLEQLDNKLREGSEVSPDLRSGVLSYFPLHVFPKKA